MALNKEIWLNTIQENFYPDNSFAAKSVDDSGFVNYKTVHIPNAGTPSGVEINRKTKPASITTRTDYDLTYNMDELTTNPIYIPHIDTVELSYDKRQSIIFNDRNQLQTAAAQSLLYGWAADGITTVKTSGSARAAHTTSTATGNRKKLVKADILAISTLFNSQDLPMEGRYVLLDAAMYNDLLEDLTDKELSAFLASANAQQGVLGRLFGFDIMLRSQVLRTTAAGKVLKWSETAVATELAAALAWQQSCVSRAMGEVNMFQNMGDPTYYGDIYSFLMRTGGSIRRYDKKGVVLLIEDTAA